MARCAALVAVVGAALSLQSLSLAAVRDDGDGGGGFWKRHVEPAAPVALKTERAIVFKDGYSLIVLTASGTADAEGRVFTADVPDSAVLGAFWASAEEGSARLRSMTAEWIESTETRTSEFDATNITQILRANTGSELGLLVPSGEAATPYRTITARIERVLDSTPGAPASQEQPAPAAWSSPLVSRDLTPTGAAFVLLRMGDGSASVMPIDNIRSITAPSIKLTCGRIDEVNTRTKRLTFDFGPESAGKEVKFRVLYFAPGLRWIPTYRIGLPADPTSSAGATMNLQGELLNELVDLEAARVDLVIGVPNFRFRDVVSPLTLEAAMRNALNAAAPQIMGQMAYSNAQFQNRAGEWSDPNAGDMAGAAAMTMAPEIASGDLGGVVSGTDDLSVFSLGEMRLKKGSRRTVPLWDGAAPIRHVYTLDMAIVRSQSAEYAQYVCKDRYGAGQLEAMASGNSPLALSGARVWHQIELRNGGSMPWTTGPALLLKGDIPLGQDLLAYTPPTATALVPVTVAVDIGARLTEEEVGRQPDAYSWAGYTYAIVKKRATMTITSRRKEPSPVRVSLALGGRAGEVSGEGKLLINDFRPEDWSGNDGSYRPNNHSDVTWDLELAPGETKTLTVDYLFYVR